MEDVRKGMDLLAKWEKKKFWTAAGCKGKKIANAVLWAETHDLCSNHGLTIKWEWDSSQSVTYKSALEIANAHGIPNS